MMDCRAHAEAEARAHVRTPVSEDRPHAGDDEVQNTHQAKNGSDSLAASRAHEMDEDWRPRTRGDCSRVPRPCPYVSCRHHLFLDVTSDGKLLPMFPGLELSELEDSCSLDLAERAGMTLAEVGELMGRVSRERIRQIEVRACRKLRLPLYRLAPSDFEDSAHVDEPEPGELSYLDMESAIVVGSFEP